MEHYSALLSAAIRSMIEVKEEKDIDSLFSGGRTTALVHTIAGLDDFELIAFLVIEEGAGMTACLLRLPQGAAFGRVVPKSKIYEHAGAGTALKDLFVTQVDQIVWKYKLAPETMNLAATKAVSEIQVFGISLRDGKLDEEVLRAIDRAIPFPLIFELTLVGRGRRWPPSSGRVMPMPPSGLSATTSRLIGLPTTRRAGRCRSRLILAASTTHSSRPDADAPLRREARTSRHAWRGWRRSGPRRGRWTGSRPACPREAVQQARGDQCRAARLQGRNWSA